MEKLFIYRQSWRSDFDVSKIKALFPVCTLTWRVNKDASRQREGIDRRNKSTKT